MSGIVQHKSAVANGARNQAQITFDSPSAKGNMIVVVSATNPTTDGVVANLTLNGVQQVGFFQDAVANTTAKLSFHISYGVLTSAGTVAVDTDNADGDLVSTHVHVFEVAGYNTLDQSGGKNSATGTAISQALSTQQALEIIFGVFTCDSGSATFTFSDTLEGEEQTTDEQGTTVASGAFEVSSAGLWNIPATSSVSGQLTGFALSFYNIAPAPPSGGTAYLGRVRVLGSAPAGAKVPYLGTVKVVDSAPTGGTNPYLGSVVLGTPGAANTNPSLGEVTVVTEVPAGSTDAFLGSVETS